MCRWQFEDSSLFFHERLPPFDRHVARRRNRFVHSTLQGHAAEALVVLVFAKGKVTDVQPRSPTA